MAGGNVVEIQNEGQWNELISNAKNDGKTVIVDFTATWCGPCQMIGPYFITLSSEYPQLIFAKVDVDKVEKVAQTCGISAMPTFQAWKDGAKVDDFVGASKDKLKAMIEKYAA